MKKYAFTAARGFSSSQTKVCRNAARGFTLAEVLITLTIIGVIAALTIPNLMQKWQDRADIVKVKKAYSILDNALRIMISENGALTELNWPEPDGVYKVSNGEYFAKTFAKYLKVRKYCGANSGCFDNNYKTLRGLTQPTQPSYYPGKMLLNNGMSLYLHIGNAPNNLPAANAKYTDSYFYVDINGKKGPNRRGYDVFLFGITANGMIPTGGSSGYAATHCAINGSDAADWDGVSCYYWISRHGNMDYKYRDVSSEW